MQLSITLFDLIVLLGVLQGSIVVLLLRFLPGRDNSKMLFCWVLIILTLLSFKILMHTLGLWNQPQIRYFPLAIDTTLQPLLYLYICSITTPAKPPKFTWIHFLPTILFMLYAAVIYILVLPKHSLNLKDELANQMHFNAVKSAEDVLAVISAFTYWIVGYKRITDYRQWLFRTQSDSSLQELTWLKNMLLLSGMLVIGLIGNVLLDDVLFKGGHHFLHLQLFYLYITSVIYYLSLKGMQLYGVAKSTLLLPIEPVLGSMNEQPEDLDNSLSKSSTRDLQELETVKELIVHALEHDRLFLNPKLTVKELAQHIGCPSSVVSSAINQCFQINFRNLINKFRVEEVKKQLLNPPAHLSVLGIALECGFNSEASFYRIFRQQTGISPSDFVKKHQP